MKMSDKPWAILIYHLPQHCRETALSCFQRQYVRKTLYKKEIGLEIYFNDYDYVRSSIIRGKIVVEGIVCRIFPLVTSLTICGFRRHAPRYRLAELMANYGPVINHYPFELNVSKTNRDDYRIILDVPEVIANFSLEDIPSLEDKRYSFGVLFFCRLCRQNGHKQYQCPTHFASMSSLQEDPYLPGYRRVHEMHGKFVSDDSMQESREHIICSSQDLVEVKIDGIESEVGDNNFFSPIEERFNYDQAGCSKMEPRDEYIDNTFRIKAEVPSPTQYCAEERFGNGNICHVENKESRIEPMVKCDAGRMPEEILQEKRKCIGSERNATVPFNVQCDTMDLQSKCIRNSGRAAAAFIDRQSYLNNVPKNIDGHLDGSRRQSEHLTRTAILGIKRETSFERRHRVERYPSSVPASSVDDGQRSATKNSHLGAYGKEDIPLMRTTANRKREGKKRRNDHSCSSVLSPRLQLNRDLLEILTSSVPGNDIIPPKAEQRLIWLLSYWNKVKDKVQLGQKEKPFVSYLKIYKKELDRKRRRFQEESERSGADQRRIMEVGTSGELSRSRKNKKYLSSGIREVILKMSTGVLSPDELLNFLNQVRGREKKTKAEIATYFTEDVLGLASQLKDVVRMYYVHGKRGSEEDVDVKFIRNLERTLMLSGRKLDT